MSSRKVLLLKCKVYVSMGNLILGLNSRYEWILVMVEAESGVCFCGHLGAMRSIEIERCRGTCTAWCVGVLT